MRYRFFLPKEDAQVIEMIRKRGHIVQNVINEHTNGVIFTGGEDVTPFLYGEQRLPDTQSNIVRDREEIDIFKELAWDLPKIGICRGAQFLNVMSGGRLWQHVDNHGVRHMLKMEWHPDEKVRESLDNGIRLFLGSSTHHQMMIPGDLGDVWASARQSTKKLSARRVEEIKDNDWDDPEVIYYWQTCCLCFQPHPEYSDTPECTKYFWDCVESMMPKEKKSA